MCLVFAPALFTVSYPWPLSSKYKHTWFYTYFCSSVKAGSSPRKKKVLLRKACWGTYVSSFWYISNKMQRYTVYLFLENCSTCFGWHLHPYSGAHTTVFTVSGTCQTVTATCRYRGRLGTLICHTGLLTACVQEHMLLLASCQQTCMTYTIAVCTVKNSWWWIRGTARNM